MRTVGAYIAGLFTAIAIWLTPLIVLDLNGIGMGTIPAAITGGIGVWIGLQVLARVKARTIAEAESLLPDKDGDEVLETKVSPSRASIQMGRQEAIAKTFWVLSQIFLLLAGISVGFLIRNYLQSIRIGSSRHRENVFLLLPRLEQISAPATCVAIATIFLIYHRANETASSEQVSRGVFE